MERLTERTENGIVGNNDRVENYPLYKIADIDPLDYRIVGQCFEKLANYEDLEEQGLLLRLPCKVGTTVWKIDRLFYRDRKGCKECIYYGNDGLGEYCDYYGCNDEDLPPSCTKPFEKIFKLDMLDDFGKTVFLTREEAEQELEKMKGEGE